MTNNVKKEESVVKIKNKIHNLGYSKTKNSSTKRTHDSKTNKVNNPKETNKFHYNEKILIENFVALQKAMTNMSIKFGELSNNISKLLGVFEKAAESLATSESAIEKDVGGKINSLLEQNKTIAQNLILMEDKLKRQQRIQMNQQRPIMRPQGVPINRPLPQGRPQQAIQSPKPLPPI